MKHPKDNERDLQRIARQSCVDRRTFLSGAAAIGVSAAGAWPLFSRPAKAQPRKGGTFRVAIGDSNTSDSLDPATWISQFQICYARTALNHLTEINADNRAVPELAESWEATPDAKEWVFKLRRGVEFHNGKSFEAADVVASFNHHRGEASASNAKSLLASVDDILAEDAHTVRFKLTAANADFPYIVADYHFAIYRSDEEGGMVWRDGVGTGGYVLVDDQPGVRMKLLRNANYWKEGRAHFDEVVYLAIRDAVARQTALRTGEVDCLAQADKTTAHLLQQDQNIVLLNVPTGQSCTFPMHMDVAPFDSNDFRLALKLSFDREQAIEKIQSGFATIGNDHPIPSIMPYFDASLEQRTYDPDRARFHLKRAGMDKITIPVSFAESVIAGAADLVALFKEMAAAAGITLKPVREPSDGYWSNVWLTKPFLLGSWSPRPVPDMILTTAYVSTAAWNESHFRSEQLDSLIASARAELDDAKRADIYSTIQRMIRDEGGTIIPFFQNTLDAHVASVSHNENVTNDILDGGRAAERWWYSS